MINFQHFPKSHKAPTFIMNTVQCFHEKESEIDSTHHRHDSNDILSMVRGRLELIGYKVESGKTSVEKIIIPVLYGKNNIPDKTFEADAYDAINKVVLEVEAAAAVANNRFLKDLFEACVMDEVDYCIIAVRNLNKTTNNGKDFDLICRFMETIYASNKLFLPLKGVTIIGY